MTSIAGLGDDQRQRLASLLRRCAVQIQAGGTTGTGFFIAPQQVMTCRHVVAAAVAPRTAGISVTGLLGGSDEPGTVAAEAADLRARVAGEGGEDAAPRADLLAAAGLANAIAGRIQPAIEDYRQALDLVGGHQDATLGLADALLVEGWGKPLRDVAGQFARAVGLLDASYDRHPLESRTSWSLMTYSYLASALSNQAAARAREREVWRAPIVAARSIAFDPAQAQRWVRLAETLIELNCDQAAAVLSSHATKLAPGDLVVRRNRIATRSGGRGPARGDPVRHRLPAQPAGPPHRCPPRTGQQPGPHRGGPCPRRQVRRGRGRGRDAPGAHRGRTRPGGRQRALSARGQRTGRARGRADPGVVRPGPRRP